MICPKCQRELPDTVECPYCGIVFEKHAGRRVEQPAPRKRPSLLSKWLTDWRRAGILAAGGLLVMTVLAVAVTTLVTSSKPPVKRRTAAVDTLPQRTKPRVTSPAAGAIAAKLAAFAPPRNEIESARLATVFIRTPGDVVGSGFFIDDQCHVVTNRHVIRATPDNLEAIRQRMSQLEKLVNLERMVVSQQQFSPDQQDMQAEVMKKLIRDVTEFMTPPSSRPTPPSTPATAAGRCSPGTAEWSG